MYKPEFNEDEKTILEYFTLTKKQIKYLETRFHIPLNITNYKFILAKFYSHVKYKFEIKKILENMDEEQKNLLNILRDTQNKLLLISHHNKSDSQFIYTFLKIIRNQSTINYPIFIRGIEGTESNKHLDVGGFIPIFRSLELKQLENSNLNIEQKERVAVNMVNKFMQFARNLINGNNTIILFPEGRTRRNRITDEEEIKLITTEKRLKKYFSEIPIFAISIMDETEVCDLKNKKYKSGRREFKIKQIELGKNYDDIYNLFRI